MEQLSRKEADKLANTITGDHGIGTADYFAETVDAYWYKNNYGLEGAIGMSIIQLCGKSDSWVVDCLALAQKNWIGTGSSIKTPYPLYAVGNTQTLALTFMFPDDGAGVTCASFENGEEEFNTFLEEDWCFFGGFLERPKRKQ